MNPYIDGFYVVVLYVVVMNPCVGDTRDMGSIIYNFINVCIIIMYGHVHIL